MDFGGESSFSNTTLILDRLLKCTNRENICNKLDLTCDFQLRRSGDDGADAVEGGHALVHSLVGAVGAGVKHGGEVEGPIRQESPADKARIKSFTTHLPPSLKAIPVIR